MEITAFANNQNGAPTVKPSPAPTSRNVAR